MTAKNNLQDWLDEITDTDIQLNLNFDDNMISGSMAQPALTISASGTDTITLGNWSTSTGAIGGTYNYSNITYGPSPAPPPIYTVNTGTGGYLGASGSNGLSWSDLSNVGPGSLQVRGDAEFDGDVKIKGKSLNKTLEKIEEKLAILHPNEELEEKWEQLRELRKQYMELEKEITEKEKMWDILKR